MKSKISFFNKTIFKKNITLYWPIWGVYTLVLLLFQPMLLWIYEYNSRGYFTYTYGDHLENLISVLFYEIHAAIVVYASILIGMALYHYMYNTKSANMIHALPVDRRQLYGTNVISGLLFLAAPQLLSTVLTMIVAVCFGIKEIHFVLYWFLMMFGTDIAAMGIVTFCAMFTGHIVVLPVLFFIANYFVYWIYYLVQLVVVNFGYGIQSLGHKFTAIIDFFSPINAFINCVYIRIEQDTNNNYECIGMEAVGVEVIVAYALVGIVLYCLGYLVYKKRQIECAGEVLCVNWVKPIFRFVIGATGGLLGALILREIFHSIGIRSGVPSYIIMMLLLGAVCYFVADMIVKKSFHVFKKKNWIYCGIFSMVLLCTFGGLYTFSNSLENRIPKMEELKGASIDLAYQVYLEDEEMASVLAIHQQILENKAFCESVENNGNSNYDYVQITYKFKDGDYEYRSYCLPREYEETLSIFQSIYELEDNSENYLRYIFCENYEKIDTFNYGWVEMQYTTDAPVDEEDYAYGYETIELQPEQSEEHYKAIIADVKSGALMKYNVSRNRVVADGIEVYEKYTDAALFFEYKNPNVVEQVNEHEIIYAENSLLGTSTTTEYVDYGNWYSTYLNFGPDCENIINKLIEFGFIESVDDIWWGESSEEQLKYQ